jgi:hypothetical protein
LPLGDPIGFTEDLREELSEEDMGLGRYFLGRAVYKENYTAPFSTYHAGENKVRQTQQSVLGAFFRAMPALSE